MFKLLKGCMLLFIIFARILDLVFEWVSVLVSVN
jgi:hypothetical protein